NAVTGAEDSSLIAFPGLLSGNASLSLFTRLQGAEINGLYSLVAGPNGRLSVLAGFRYLDLHERLGLASSSVGIAGGALDGFVNIQDDVFETSNHFYGGQLGLQGELRFGSWFINGSAKLALGTMQEIVEISGLPGPVIH